MCRFLQKTWTAILGAVAGAALGLVATIVLAQQNIAPVEAGLIAVWILAGCGAALGFIFGGRKKPSPAH